MTLQRSIAATLCASMLCASCMTAPRVINAPASYIPIQHPSKVWIIDRTGNSKEVEQPRVLGDSLYGRTVGGDEVWVALDGTQGTIRARELDKTKTYLAVAGVLGAITLGAFMMSGGGQSEQFMNEDSYVAGRHGSAFNIRLFHIGAP